ncbi:MAG: T9SS type A sorting domain-containing protein [Sporocytophaga sp.]|uniref:T9SS type A sorting domain-containing protein n=1 Tax=Sporocytophaga sp. TaxID=2231183 RepID=UPI001B0C9DB7|nr:T9SS type A sorting domain-containing protein [Sporocytophaga sp.]MBO9702235.1 T9SS type A sorting domain-containing protein [Sporocytophaga sp.]
MKKLLLTILSALSLSAGINAQTTDTYIVADNPAAISSCVDSVITLADIIQIAGIHDLNDPNDDVSMYKMFRLQGAVITTDELTSIHYSDYSSVFVKKMNATSSHHGGIQVYLYLITPPTSIFSVDTLKYTVEKGATINFTSDFFAKFTFFSSGKDLTSLNERILFTDQSIGTEAPIGIGSMWSIVGRGKYKIRVQVAVCNPTDYYYDSIYVIVDESPCLKLEIKNMPSVCREDILDITPYVYLDDHLATSADLSQMTFINKSLLGGPGETFDPIAMDMTQMVDKTSRYPILQIAYQPNVALGMCTNYSYMPTLKVPTKLSTSDVVLTKNNYGAAVNYTLDGDYYGFNDMFSKDVFKKLYIDNFTSVHGGTNLDFYSDEALTVPVSDNNLTPGTYYITATNQDCSDDSTLFKVNVKNKDFDIIWQSAPAIGKGYYTFNAPVYSGATYAWFAWGGSMISGNNTNQLTVYFSETAAPSVNVSCTITLPAVRTTINSNGLSSAVYITSDENGNKEEIKPGITTSVISSVSGSSLKAYPNPSAETFALSGSGSYDVKIYNSVGQLVFTNTLYKAETPITVLNKGLYVVHATQNGISQIVKVIVE